MSIHHTRFAVKDLRRERTRWRTRQDHAAEPGVPARNENDWSGGGHLCPQEGQTGGMPERGRDQNRCFAVKDLVRTIDQLLSDNMSKAEIRMSVLDTVLRDNMSKENKFKEANAFELDEKNSTERWRAGMASVELNALEIRSVQVMDENCKFRMWVIPCAAATVIPTFDLKVWRRWEGSSGSSSENPGETDRTVVACLAECCGSRDDRLSWNLSRAKQCDAIQVDSMDPQGQDAPRSWKVKIKLKDGSLRLMNMQMAEMHRDLIAVSEVNDAGHDAFISRNQMCWNLILVLAPWNRARNLYVKCQQKRHYRNLQPGFRVHKKNYRWKKCSPKHSNAKYARNGRSYESARISSRWSLSAKVTENHETIRQLTSQLQQMQEQMNSMNDSGDFQDVESNYSVRLSHVSSQLAMIPSSLSMLSRDKRLPFDTGNHSGLQENVFWTSIFYVWFIQKSSSKNSIWRRAKKPAEGRRLFTQVKTDKIRAQVQCRHLQQGRRLRVLQDRWNCRRTTWSDSRDSNYRSCNSTHSLIHKRFWCRRFDSEIKWLHVRIFHRMLWCGSKKWRWLILWTSWNPRDQFVERIFQNFEMLDAKIASALNKIMQNSQFKKTVSLVEQKAQKEDRFLRGRQIAFMIYDYFRVIGAHDYWIALIFSLSLFMMITLRNSMNSVQDGTKFYYLCQRFHPMISWKSVQIENTWVRATQNRIGIVRHGDSSEDIDAQISKIEDDGEEKYRSETSITKLWRQARKNWNRSSGQESKGINRRWRRKRYLLPVERKRPVFERRPMQFPAWE